jgi:hypothetical protein
MNTGDWVMYEATHQGHKERRLGKVRWCNQAIVDVTWYWVDSEYQDPHPKAFYSTSVVRKYCTQLTEEVAQVFLTANTTKE